MPQTLFIMPFFKKTPPYDYYQENLFSHVLIIKFGEKLPSHFASLDKF